MILIEALLEAGSKLHSSEKFGNLDELTDEELEAETKRLCLLYTSDAADE